jgi:hypothetical protein
VPALLRPVLTMKGMDAPSWEPALSFHLPKNPGVELLDRASEEVLTYLDWVSHDVASAGDAAEIRKEITRAAVRLIEISLYWRAACDAEHEQGQATSALNTMRRSST